MALLNICRDNKDPFYRYKMPPIVSKIEGRGNGIRTAVVNASEVARALSRPCPYVIKFFGFELGAQTKVDENNDRYIVNGAHDAPKLQDLLDSFINKFVLCASCRNPETDLIISKDGNITRVCKACGQRTKVDPGHKLTSFIVKNPPANSKSKKKAATASANVGGAAVDAGSGAGSDSGNGNANGADNADGEEDDELTKRINSEAAGLPDESYGGDDDSWTVDVSEEAVRARQKELERSLAVLDVNGDDDEEDETVYSELGEWISSEKPSDVEIYKKASEMGIADKHLTIQVLAQTLFTENIATEIEDHEGLLTKMITSKNHEKALLGGIERLIGLNHPDKIKSIPVILSKLYQNDLVSEDVLLKWGTRVSKKYVDKETSKKVRKAAKPFIDWLQEAESESESDDE
uniref:ARAD1B18788p n=1 Tax=Blastobotrys adeninivorans TaxID=409370 RepID=A0A060TBZ9_BLAAD